jgi:hypothetical protein
MAFRKRSRALCRVNGPHFRKGCKNQGCFFAEGLVESALGRQTKTLRIAKLDGHIKKHEFKRIMEATTAAIFWAE